MSILLAPFFAIIPSIIFACYYHKTKLRINFQVAIFWGVYGVYEYTVQTYSADSNIRVDLLVLYPLLVATSLYAIIKTVLVFENIKNIVKTKLFITNILLLFVGFTSLFIQNKYYGYIDENNVLVDSIFLPIGVMCLLSSFIILFFTLIYFCFKIKR